MIHELRERAAGPDRRRDLVGRVRGVRRRDGTGHAGALPADLRAKRAGSTVHPAQRRFDDPLASGGPGRAPELPA